MSTSLFSRKFCTFFVIAAFLGLAVQSPAHADIIGTEQLVAQAQTDATKADLAQLLTREDIQAKMLDLGVDKADVESRINNMTDTELNDLYAGLDSLPAGGDALGTVLTLLLIFLILDIAGVTDIFPGV